MRRLLCEGLRQVSHTIDHIVLEMRDSNLIWWKLFFPSCQLRYWASPFRHLDTFQPSIVDIFSSKFVQLTTPAIALASHPRVRYNMGRSPEQADAHLVPDDRQADAENL